MAVNLTFADFDTVCYSNQHNIMQLINGAVQISVSLINLEHKVDDIPQDLEARIDALERAFNTIARRLDAVYNFTSPFNESVTGVKITNLENGT